MKLDWAGATVGSPRWLPPRTLATGEGVSGFVEINDSPRGTPNSSPSSWYLEVLNPSGYKIYSKSKFISGNNNIKFYFEAKESGEYTTKIGHYSDSEKLLFLKIAPTGWTIEHIDGSNASGWD